MEQTDKEINLIVCQGNGQDIKTQMDLFEHTIYHEAIKYHTSYNLLKEKIQK